MAEELKINIIGDASKLKGALGEAGSQVTKFAEKIGSIGKTMTIVGGAITAAFGVIIKKTMDAGDQFDKMSLRTGETVENLSSLAYACDITGTSIEGLETGIKFLTKGMDDAQKGMGEAKDAFEELKISIVDIEGNLRPTVDVLKEAATKIAAIENPAKQAALAMELFGARSGTQLIPLLKEGGAGIEELMKKAKELGITMSTEAASAAAEFKDRLTDLKGSLAGAGRDIAMILIPPLTKLAEKAVEIVKRIREWTEAHPVLIEWIVKIGATLGALAAVGGPILIAASAFLKMQGAITALGTISAGPIGIFIVAIAGIVLGANKLTERLRETVGGLREFREEINKMSLLQLDIEIQNLTDTIEQLQKRFSEIPKGIGQQELLTIMDEINKRLEILYGKRKELTEMATGVDTLTDSMGELGEEAKDAIGEIDKAIKEINDRLYELTHTAIENATKKLEEQRQAYIDLGVAIGIVDEWHSEEIKKLNDVSEAYDTFLDAMKTVEDRMFELTHTQREVEIKQLDEKKAKLIEVAKQAGLSADEEIAKIKEIMAWYQKEIDLLNKKETTLSKRYYDIYNKKGERIGVMTSAEQAQAYMNQGYNVMESIYNPAEVVPGQVLPKLQTGTSLVKKTGLAIIEKDEAVLTPEQNKAYRSGGNQFTVNINNPVVRNNDDIVKIRREIEKALSVDMPRQYKRSGYELAY